MDFFFLVFFSFLFFRCEENLYIYSYGVRAGADG